jgi:hypothetical protein
MDWETDWDGRPVYYDRQGKPMTMQQWAQMFEDEGYRHIARDVIGPDEPLDTAPLITVSTLWLGLNHDWRSDEPLIYETIIIGGEHDATGMRHATERRAREGHRPRPAWSRSGPTRGIAPLGRQHRGEFSSEMAKVADPPSVENLSGYPPMNWVRCHAGSGAAHGLHQSKRCRFGGSHE